MKFQIFISLVSLSTALSAVAQNSAPAPTAPQGGVQRVPQPARPAQSVPPGGHSPIASHPGQPAAPGAQQTSPTLVVTNGMVPQLGVMTNPLGAANQQLLGTNAQFPGTNGFDRDDLRFGTNGFDSDDWRFRTNGFDRDDWRFGHTNDFDRDDWRFGHTNGWRGSNQFNIHTNVTGTNAFGVVQPPPTNFTGDVAFSPQDGALLIRLRARLAPELRGNRMPIRLSSQNGVVTISGAVPSAEEAQEFISLVQQTPGVVSVMNNLRIVPGLFSMGGGFGEDRGFSAADRGLLGQVRRHMHRHGRGQGASESVHIVARNGIITLVGFVSSVEEKQALEAAVQSTPGVVQVNDQLQVRTAAGGETDQTGAAAVGGSAQFGGGTGFSTGAGGSFNLPSGGSSASSGNTNAFGTNTAPTPPR